MNSRSLRLTTACLLAALPLSPLAAMRGPHGRPFAGGPPAGEARMDRLAQFQSERLTRILDLTPDQQVELGRLQERLEATVRPLGDSMRAAHEQLRTLLESATPDPTAVGTQAIAIDRARDGMRTAWERFETDFSATLTESQRSAYRVLQEARPGHDGPFGRHGRGPGGPWGPGGPEGEGPED